MGDYLRSDLLAAAVSDYEVSVPNPDLGPGPYVADRWRRNLGRYGLGAGGWSS